MGVGVGVGVGVGEEREGGGGKELLNPTFNFCDFGHVAYGPTYVNSFY